MAGFLVKLLPATERIPDVVYVELVDILFAPLVPIFTIGATLLGIGALIAGREHDAVLAALTLAGVLISIGRVWNVLAYRRCKALAALSATEARRWECRYAVGSVALAILIGALNVRALIMGYSLAPLLIVGLIFGYGAGVVTRLAIRPVICIASLVLAALPTAIGFAAQLARGGGFYPDVVNAATAVLIASFTLISFETVASIYRTTLQQLLTKRDLAELVGQDALTGLPNRVLLRSRFSEAAARMGRSGVLLAFHCLDLDRFKAVNDTFGHPTGDALLQAVAARLVRTLQAGDTVARIGGDEFVVVQPGIRHADEARLLAQRIIRVVSAPYSIGGHDIRIGVSIGIALMPNDGINLEQLTARADSALYQAKHKRKGGAVFWIEVLPEAGMTAGSFLAS